VKRVLALLILLLFLAECASAEEMTFLSMKQSGYDLSDIVTKAQSFERATGIRVNTVFVEYKDRYSLVTAAATNRVPDHDLILLDLIWTADFATHGIIDPLPPALARSVTAGMVPGIYAPFEYHHRIWALPFPVDFQVLCTNLDLLSRAGYERPPRTIEELERMAKDAKRRGVLEYPVFDSWNEREVLVCEFTWLVGAFGGALTDRSGRITCTTPARVAALRFMTRLLAEGLVNPYSHRSGQEHAGLDTQRHQRDLSVKIAATSSKAREALAQYIAHPLVSLKKMLVEEPLAGSRAKPCGRHAGSVLYQSEHNPCFRTSSRLFPATEFLVEVLQHLPDAGARLIRRYGLYSSRSRGTWSRKVHLTRLAPEGWQKDHQPQPAVRLGPALQDTPDQSVSAKESCSAWARPISRAGRRTNATLNAEILAQTVARFALHR
jgi:hypothetical protein